MANDNERLHNPTMRVINILEEIDNSPEGLTLSELAERINSPKSTISPIIHTLLAKGYLKVDEMLRYKIGIRSFLLGISSYLDFKGIRIITNEMQGIVDACNEVCQLGKLVDFDVLYLAIVDSKQPIKLVSSVGKRLPAYATALGKALLSKYSDEDLRAHYGNKLKPITKNTITDIEMLLKQIREIRRGKLASEFGEINEEIGCIATPLIKGDDVIASISVSFPLYRATEDKLRLIEKVLYEKRPIIEELIRKMDLTL